MSTKKLNYIENKDLLMKYALEINEPIVSLLDNAIEDKILIYSILIRC